jgi:hypothetical protein
MRRDPTVAVECVTVLITGCVLLWVALCMGCASTHRPAAVPFLAMAYGPSNEPVIHSGTLLAVRPAKAAEVELGEFVTYRRKDGLCPTHPVIGWSALNRGWLIVQGANRATNPRPDAEFVTDENLLGVATPLNR